MSSGLLPYIIKETPENIMSQNSSFASKLVESFKTHSKQKGLKKHSTGKTPSKDKWETSFQPRKSSKETQNDDGFSIFNTHIPQAMVGFCKKFMKRNPSWDSDVIPQTEYEWINLISRNRGENLSNLDDFTGGHMASMLECVMRDNLKWDEISLPDIVAHSPLLEKLKNTQGLKNKKKITKTRLNTSTPKKRARSVSSGYEDSDNETVISKNGAEVESDAESEYESDKNMVGDNTAGNESSASMPDHPPTPGYVKTPKRQKRSANPQREKKSSAFEGSDSDSFDPVIEEEITGYDPLGDIAPDTTRIVIKGANKNNFYGVGPKPVALADTKNKGKNGGKGTPQPGDVGFFKLGLLGTPQPYNDGTRVINVKYDYCSFNSDWAAKKELFINMMLRAYSQKAFNPQAIFKEEDEIGFTDKIEGFMKDFIINQLAGDTNAIRKEAVSMYNVIKANLKKKSVEKMGRDAMRLKGMGRK